VPIGPQGKLIDGMSKDAREQLRTSTSSSVSNERGHVRFWHKADITIALTNVRFRG
jgi:hypothetical protein